MEQIKQFGTNHGTQQLQQLFPSNGKHAVPDDKLCRVSRRNLEHANDRLKRANRDLGETAAFIAASLTTITAVEAVINIAIHEINLSVDILRVAFDVYIAIFLIIFLWGAFRAQGALHKRARAEQEIDQAKRGIFEHCSDEPLPKPEEE
jgi:cytochrome c biogenesis protein CcdA